MGRGRLQSVEEAQWPGWDFISVPIIPDNRRPLEWWLLPEERLLLWGLADHGHLLCASVPQGQISFHEGRGSQQPHLGPSGTQKTFTTQKSSISLGASSCLLVVLEQKDLEAFEKVALILMYTFNDNNTLAEKHEKKVLESGETC